MRFTPSPDHRDFAASIGALLAKSDVPAAARSWADGDTAPGLAVWDKLAATGVTALLVDDDHGGMGADAVDMVIAVEHLGRHAVPGPVADTIAAAPVLLAGAPDRLGAVASGSLVSVAAPPVVPFALDADAASLVLLASGDGVALAAPGDPQPSVDPARRLFRVTAEQELGGADVASAIDHGALATAAQLLGLGGHLLETSTEYATSRKQFGTAIGTFQAIKHHLAEVAVGIEMARPLLHGAAVALRDRDPESGRDISAAKVACGDAAYRAARIALQVHGAIGYTQEYDLSLWLTKVRALVTAWGTPAWHRERVALAVAS
ncbi:acyl-CoA dehydrogenase [Rhodococcus rhodnii]|uniref:Acyl-CoA dehydrogenase n=2 Tax=Rhodococcus rhodnii TaxID=38312 RepID=A0A6P2CBZ3_9NOCA|nr:acyl-CoA dehydrogenase [Rhodococcus rhodnii]EOM74516.1 putative acyl-CoA dehydrogenase [Rhodococcus rhodnii LMG 5362]TXG89201.1 acyl-CoA dehydrogenase [Rhodococcus rhodnii]